MTLIDPRDLKSFVRMFTEVGLCIWCLVRFSDQLWLAPATLAIYFIGNLAHAGLSVFFEKSFRTVGLLLPVGLVAAAIAMRCDSIPALGAALFLTGFAMGVSWEPAAPGSRKRLIKIGAKLLGMMCSAVVLVGPEIFGFVAAGLSVWLVAMNLSGRTIARATAAGQWRGVDTINIFHQSAYFSFVYVFWAALPGVPHWTPALLFPLGWFGYWGMELSLSADGQPYRPRTLAAGHAIVSMTMVVMAMTGSPALVIFCWFVTGLGGGTCYTMERAPGGRPGRLSDDIGAVLGVGGSALALLWFRDPAAAMGLAAIHATIATIAALYMYKSTRHGG
jgi:hypothetical protein